CDLSDFSRRVISRFNRREDRRAIRVIVFERDQRLVVHSTSKKIPEHSLHASWWCSEEEIEKINEMDAIGKSNARIGPRAFESAESRAQHLEPSKLPTDDRVSHPYRGRIEPKNMPNLQNQSGFVRQLR